VTFNDMVAQLAHFAWGALLVYDSEMAETIENPLLQGRP